MHFAYIGLLMCEKYVFNFYTKPITVGGPKAVEVEVKVEAKAESGAHN